MKSLQPPACNRLAVKQLAGRLKTLKKKNGFTQHHFDCFGILKPLNLNRRLKLRENGAGFTLLELLVVIAVLGILAGTVMVLIDPVSKMAKSRDAQRRSDIRQIAQALELYGVENEKYPPEPLQCDSSIGVFNCWCDDASAGCQSYSNWNQSSGGTGGSEIYAALVTGGYVKVLPKDPINQRISWGNTEPQRKQYFYKYEPYSKDETNAPASCPGAACRYWIGARLERPSDPNKPFFRCSNNENLAGGVGCVETGTVVEIIPAYDNLP